MRPPSSGRARATASASHVARRVLCGDTGTLAGIEPGEPRRRVHRKDGLDETLRVVEADAHLLPGTAATLPEIEGEVVEQLVRQHDAGPGEPGQVGDGDGNGTAAGRLVARRVGIFGGERHGRRREREMLGVTGAHGRRPVDEHPAQRPEAVGLGDEDRAGQRARPGTGLDDDEGVGLAELAPPPVELAGDHRAEERSHLGRGDEVTAAPARRSDPAGVETGHRVVQRLLDERRERHGPTPPDALDDSDGGVVQRMPPRADADGSGDRGE